MKVIILSPPVISPFAPPLSLISLKSYLSNNNIKVYPIDTSIDCLHYLLSPENIKRNYLISRKKWDTILTIEEKNKILKNSLGNNIDFSTLKLEKINKFLDNIWNYNGFSISKNNFSFEISYINDILLFTYSHFFPTILTLESFSSKISLIKDNTINPFIDYYYNKLFPEIKNINPDLIGISFSYSQQIIPGLSLINEIGKITHKPIVVGGSWFSILCDKLSSGKESLINFKNISLSKISILKVIYNLLAPYGIHGEGELPFLELCNSITKNKSVFDIPGLVYKDENLKTVKFNGIGNIIPTTNLPILNLDGFDIKNKYLTPIPIAPIMSSRGCYWNKCTFCNHSSVINKSYRELPVDIIIKTLEHFHNNDIKYALFCDEAMSSVMLNNISNELINKNFKIFFGTMCRIEKEFINIVTLAKNAGLKSISFGFESANKRVIGLMKKGFTNRTAISLIDKCFTNNIFVHLHIMFGFPSETINEARETNNFLETYYNKITCIRPHKWFLSDNTPISKNIEKYKNIHNTNVEINNYPEEFINYLVKSPLLKNKIIYGIKNEEFFVIENLLKDSNCL